MKRINPKRLPKMREQGLVIDELPDEVLVYDLDRHKAHCLNQTAALVWKQCDGRTTPRIIARRLEKELQAPCNEDMVWLALSQLEGIDLLEQGVSLPPQLAGLSRREMVRALGIAAAVAVPLVTSIVAPTAAEAATCASTGQDCKKIACCPGHVCDPGTKKCT